MTEHEEQMQAVWDAYLLWFHHAGVWKRIFYHGVRTLKLPCDLWNYQEIIFERRIDYVIETGTRHGGSALYFADTLQARRAPGFVVTIDIDESSRQIKSHPRIHFVIGDSAAPDMVRMVMSMLPAERGPLFLILDSDHSKAHVLRELAAWVPVMKQGDCLVVEDTSVNGHPVRPDHGPGPWEVIHEFVATHPAALVPDRERERKFGVTFAPGGYFVKS